MKYKYIASIPKSLLNDLMNNRVIPIVGAGFSKNADLPKGVTMPDWKELGKLVSEEIPSHQYDGNAVDALSYYEELYSRPKLIELLMRELHYGEIQPGETYQAFCDFFTGTICTTNYDSLLEDTMIQSHRPISVIVSENRLTVRGHNESIIIKMHGDFNHPEKMVITENDYDLFLNQNPIMATYVANQFIANTMLLIGYSLDDNDLRGIWKLIQNRLGKMSQPAYCLTVGISEEQKARFYRRNVKVINLDGDPKDYKTILRDFFVELKDYRDCNVTHTSKSEKVNDQLLIPAENNRLCFLSCANTRIARLSGLIYPSLRNLGITPVRLDDILAPADNWQTIAESLVRKSKAAIIDVSDGNSNVLFELELIKAYKTPESFLVIKETGTPTPFVAIENRILTYSFVQADSATEESSKLFLDDIKLWCQKAFDLSGQVNSDGIKKPLFENAHILLEKKEYDACIISAYSELVDFVGKRTDREILDKGILGFIKEMVETKAINNPLYVEQFDKSTPSEFIRMRERIVHGYHKASRTEAYKYLSFAEVVSTIIGENDLSNEQEIA